MIKEVEIVDCDFQFFRVRSLRLAAGKRKPTSVVSIVVSSNRSATVGRNDLMVHVSFLEPTNEKMHQQCSRKVCAQTRSGLSDRMTNKRHRRGAQDFSTTKALHTRFKASHAIFPSADCGPRFFHTWNCSFFFAFQ